MVYEHNIELYRDKLKQTSHIIYMYGAVKLVIFCAIIAIIYLLWGGNYNIMTASIAVLVALFLALSKLQDKHLYSEEFYKQIIKINENEIKATEGCLEQFADGKEFVNSDHPYTYDIDIFGSGSLFQMLNRTGTSLGSNTLAQWLQKPLMNKAEIEARQQAVDELSELVDWRQQLLAIANVSKEDNATDGRKALMQWAESGTIFNKPVYAYLSAIVIAINVILIALVLCGIITFNMYLCIFFIFAIGSTIFSARIRQIQDNSTNSLRVLSVYSKMLRQIEKQQFRSALLCTIQGSINGNNDVKATEAIGSLEKTIHRLEASSNMILTMILNGIMLWDLKCAISMEKWKTRYAGSIVGWLDAIGNIEALCSLANFRFNNPDYVFANITDKNVTLSGERFVHPLMRNAVPNPISITAKPFFLIITGANMAGKSTYLRTVATNYLLGCIGAPICTTDSGNRLHPMQLFTSLRTNDSLRSGESYFFAELKRLKMIIDRLRSGEEMFIMLDEILRGTNSHDKQQGSYSFVKQLVELNATGIIATHDLALAHLAEVFPGNVHPMCFEADITNNELTFSYRLREGVAQNMNACFLMQKMGINIVNDLEK